MKTIFPTSVLLLALLILVGCGSSIEILSQDESLQKISELRPQLDSMDHSIDGYSVGLPDGYDLTTRTRASAINAILERVANKSLRDIHIDFLSTRPLWKDDRTILGIGYTNYIDVDTGSMDIDLKRFTFNSFNENIVHAEIEIEGTGNLMASGIYSGVWGRITPAIHFYLHEDVEFVVTTADSDYIRLNPVPKTILLKTKVTISLLGWNVPYYKEIPLQTTDLIKPVFIPSALRSEIVFPIPASQYGSERMELVKRYLRFSRSTVRADQGILEYRSNIDFEKE